MVARDDASAVLEIVLRSRNLEDTVQYLGVLGIPAPTPCKDMVEGLREANGRLQMIG